MKKVSKVKVIKDAFIEKLPEGEPWYEERLAICKICPYNSANAEDKSLLMKIKDIALEAHCTACGCSITRKAGRKEEECGLAEKGEKPKWNRLLVHTTGDDFNLINLSSERINVNLTEDGTKYVVEYTSPLTHSSQTEIKIGVEGLKPILNVTASCGCTTPILKKEKEGWEISVNIDLGAIPKGNFNKSIHVRYLEKTDKGRKTQSITIQIKGTKA